jgi:hypothetical protein
MFIFAPRQNRYDPIYSSSCRTGVSSAATVVDDEVSSASETLVSEATLSVVVGVAEGFNVTFAFGLFGIFRFISLSTTSCNSFPFSTSSLLPSTLFSFRFLFCCNESCSSSQTSFVAIAVSKSSSSRGVNRDGVSSSVVFVVFRAATRKERPEESTSLRRLTAVGTALSSVTLFKIGPSIFLKRLPVCQICEIHN